MHSLESFDPLATELERRFAAGVSSAWTDRDFDSLARRAFARQFALIAPYRALCEGRGRTPETIARWQDVPPVPATAFKHMDFIVTEATPPEAIFLTSGTSRGAAVRGRHLVARLSLYRHSLLPPFAEHVLAGAGRLPFLSLVPSPRVHPESSLSFMVGAAAQAFASEIRWLVDARGALDVLALRSAMRDAARRGTPALLLGTAVALLEAATALEADPAQRLPAGSRIMETGGFKGVGREISRVELRSRLEAATGVPSGMIVGEYGMTELLSQLYEPVLSAGGLAGIHVPPPWLRVRVLDPVSLDEVRPGSEGLLAFFDLANAGSVCHVLTEDVGSVTAEGVRLTGRARGAEPRGCSLAMDELMSAARAAGAMGSRS